MVDRWLIDGLLSHYFILFLGFQHVSTCFSHPWNVVDFATLTVSSNPPAIPWPFGLNGGQHHDDKDQQPQTNGRASPASRESRNTTNGEEQQIPAYIYIYTVDCYRNIP